MEKFKTLKSNEKGLTWKEVKEILNSKNEEDLNVRAFFWKIDDENAEISGYSIQEVLEAEEDHINPSGEGIEPVSTYEGEDISGEPVIYKKGALLGLID
ncbi:hypothetical protein [Chryseobacterium sp. JK1]|uniref:hypothetical protein n=1 Tax=Chryseobacterium sp. JK1 TaxID=874294 RepID=UPI003D6986C9